jgi:hypothetical protein
VLGFVREKEARNFNMYFHFNDGILGVKFEVKQTELSEFVLGRYIVFIVLVWP